MHVTKNALEQQKEVYTHLQDNLSKTIFKNLLLYHVTQDYKYIGKIIFSTIEEFFPEFDLLGLSNKYIKHDTVVIYGAGMTGRTSITFFDSGNIIAFCDKDTNLHGTTISGVPVISPEELMRGHSDSTVVITVYFNSMAIEIKDELIKLGFPVEKIFIFDSSVELPELQQYFDKKILPKPQKNEVFIDAGCFDFQSSYDFINWCNGNYSNIIAFEPNPNQYSTCLQNASNIKNVKIYNYGLWDKCDILHFDERKGCPTGARIKHSNEDAISVKVDTLDNILRRESATFIKMDVEGAELNALKGAANTITKHRPKLAISIYHKPEDFWEIPAYVLSLNKDYKIYLRHYAFNLPYDTILYAI